MRCSFLDPVVFRQHQAKDHAKQDQPSISRGVTTRFRITHCLNSKEQLEAEARRFATLGHFILALDPGAESCVEEADAQEDHSDDGKGDDPVEGVIDIHGEHAGDTGEES